MWINHQLWACAIVLGYFQLIHGADLRLYYPGTTLDQYEEVPLAEGKTLMDKDCYDQEKRNLCYMHGYRGSLDGNASQTVLKAVAALGIYNLFAVNWRKEASSLDINEQLVPITGQASFPIGVSGATYVGTQLGNTMLSMAEAGLDFGKTILVGHSLGGQVAAQAGRTVKLNQREIQYILGLDPAGPVYDQVLPRLDTDCATFVYIVSTDPGGYGTNKTEAHVNILVNCEYFYVETDAEKQVQPGCPVGKFPKFSNEDLCSHNFSWMFLAASLESPGSLIASKATSCQAWLAGAGNSTDTFNIGLDVDQSKRGIYCIATNSAPPFGKGAAGLTHSSA